MQVDRSSDKNTVNMMNMTNAADTEEVIDLLQLADAVWKKAWLVVLTAVLFGVCTYFGTLLLIAPTYRSYFTAYINNHTSTESTSVSNSDLVASQSLVNTYSAILVSEPVLMDAAQTAGLDMTYEELVEAVTTESVNDTEIIQVNVTLTDPEIACLLAQALANIAPEYGAKIVEGSSMQIIATPRVPDEIYSPNYIKNTAIGALLGAMLVIGIVVIRELLDDRVKNESDLEQRYGIPLMGKIPDLVEARKKHFSDYSYQYK